MDWIADISGTNGPIYLAIADAVGRAINDGRLAPGDRLPSQRALARHLKVDLTTVTRAYAQAMRLGFLVSDGRRGSFVSARNGAAPRNDGSPSEEEGYAIMNMPPEPADNALTNAIRDTLDHIVKRHGRLPLSYQPSGGGERDRDIAATFLRRLVPDTGSDQVVITAGGQNALHAVCALLLQPGCKVAAGRLTYPGFLSVARRLGTEVVGIASDALGLVPEALEEAVRDHGVRAVYVVPTNDNPTTATMDAARRGDIVAIAERHDLTIIEDDAYGQLTERPLVPLTAHAPTRSWYIASMSKALSPSLRLAFVRAPSPRAALRLTADIHETAIMAPPVNMALVAEWLLDGTYEQLVAAIGREAAARQQLAATILGSIPYAIQPRGYHLWLPVPAGLDGFDLATGLTAAALPALPSTAFAVTAGGQIEALRVSLGSARTQERLGRNLRHLEALLAERGRRNHVLI